MSVSKVKLGLNLRTILKLVIVGLVFLAFGGDSLNFKDNMDISSPLVCQLRLQLKDKFILKVPA